MVEFCSLLESELIVRDSPALSREVLYCYAPLEWREQHPKVGLENLSTVMRLRGSEVVKEKEKKTVSQNYR